LLRRAVALAAPSQPQRVWRAEIEPRLVSDTEPDALPARGGRRMEVFSPAEYRNQDGEPLPLFVALCDPRAGQTPAT
jgi:hypothetical protein